MNLAGKIGLAIGLAGGLLGLVVGIIAAPVMGSIMAAIFIIVFGWIYFGVFRGAMGGGSKKILETGLPAQATVLEVRDTGVTVNNNPQIKLILQVTPQTGMPYQAAVKLLISRLETYKFQPGMTLPVKYDPNDTSKVAIDFSGASGNSSYAAPDASQASQFQSMLQKINDDNVALMQYGEDAKAIVMKYIPMGINVNGDNPAVTLELQVLPSTRDPFKATAKGVIKDTSVPKYQPGCEIYVKYDPNDISKVTVSHS